MCSQWETGCGHLPLAMCGSRFDLFGLWSQSKMHKITLVCSVHRENGRCTVAELLKILRAISPEVIFEEVRPTDFDAYYKSRQTLEAQAITKFRESESPRQVPVDQFNDNEATVDLRFTMDRIFDVVEGTSQTYLNLLDERETLTHQQGFQYLNSVVFEKTTESIEEIEDLTIRATGNPDLIRGLQCWREAMKRREAEMVRNIYEYCRDHAFDTGVFLVGSAHKASIVKAIRARDGAEAGLIDWSFTYVDPN